MVYFVFFLVNFFLCSLYLFFFSAAETDVSQPVALSSARCTRHRFPFSPRSSADIPNLLRRADATRDTMVSTKNRFIGDCDKAGRDGGQVRVCACAYVVDSYRSREKRGKGEEMRSVFQQARLTTTR